MTDPERDDLLIRMDERLKEVHDTMKRTILDLKVTDEKAAAALSGLAAHLVSDETNLSWLKRGMIGLYALCGSLLLAGIGYALWK